MSEFKIDSAVFLATVTVFLYCCSNAKYQGFLHVFGLDIDVMERNLHQVLYSGFLVSLMSVFKAVLWLFFICFLYFSFIVIIKELNVYEKLKINLKKLKVIKIKWIALLLCL